MCSCYYYIQRTAPKIRYCIKQTPRCNCVKVRLLICYVALRNKFCLIVKKIQYFFHIFVVFFFFLRFPHVRSFYLWMGIWAFRYFFSIMIYAFFFFLIRSCNFLCLAFVIVLMCFDDVFVFCWFFWFELCVLHFICLVLCFFVFFVFVLLVNCMTKFAMYKFNRVYL